MTRYLGNRNMVVPSITGGGNIGDDNDLGLGNDPAYWFTYNSTDDRLELWSTDVDGGGTDGMLMYWEDGEPYTYMGTPTQAIRLDPSNDGIFNIRNETGFGGIIDLEAIVLNGGGTHGALQSGASNKQLFIETLATSGASGRRSGSDGRTGDGVAGASSGSGNG